MIRPAVDQISYARRVYCNVLETLEFFVTGKTTYILHTAVGFYPDFDIIKYIKENGGKLILSGDSHSADAIGFAFSDYEYLL